LRIFNSLRCSGTAENTFSQPHKLLPSLHRCTRCIATSFVQAAPFRSLACAVPEANANEPSAQTCSSAPCAPCCPILLHPRRLTQTGSVRVCSTSRCSVSRLRIQPKALRRPCSPLSLYRPLYRTPPCQDSFSRFTMRPSTGLLGLLLVAAPAVLAQNNNNNNNNNNNDLPDLATLSQPDGQGETTAKSTAATSKPASTTNAAKTTVQTTSQAAATTAASTATNGFPDVTPTQGGDLEGLPTFAGIGIPSMVIPNTNAAAFMQKSDLPDGTVFICVGAILGFLGACVLLWRMLVAWSLHRSVKRAAMAQSMADMKAMSSVPGKKRGMYNVVGASSTMSLDHLSGAPTGTSRPSKPFAQAPGGTPPRAQSSLFFSPTAGGAAGARDQGNRSSTYLPAGYYAAGNAAPASGSPMTNIGGHPGQHSTHSLAIPGNRYSTRSGISPPGSPSLPPSRGYDRAPPSRDGYRMSAVSPTVPGNTRSGVYGYGHESTSQLSLNVPGGTTSPGGRAPSAYLEDLFETHGGTSPGASKERF
jgi:hypothetical protein